MANSFLNQVSPDSEDNMNQESLSLDYTNPLPFVRETRQEMAKKVLEDDKASIDDKYHATSVLSEAEQLNVQDSQQRQAAALASEAKRFNDWQNANKKYDELQQYSIERGLNIKLPERPKPEKFGLDTGTVARYSDPQVQQAIAPVVRQQGAQTQAAQEQTALQQANILGQKAAEREQSTLQGYQARQVQIDKRQQQLMDESIKTVDDQQYKLDQIDSAKFWNSLSGGQKVLGSLAIALGEVGRALTKGGSNTALDIINKAIDRDIDAQKLNNEQKIQMKANALKRVALEVEKYSALSKSGERQFEMAKYADALKAQGDALKQQAVQGELLKKQLFSEGIGVDQVDLLSDSQKVRALVLPNGNVTLAGSKDAAEKAQSQLTENKNALMAVKQFKSSVGQLGISDKLNPFSADRARVESELEGLVGKLRVPITGPGVLNEQEYQRIAHKVLGDPTSVFTTPTLFTARINALEKLLNMGQKATYEQAGVRLQSKPSKADQLRQRMYKSGQYQPEEVESAINALAKKDPSYQE